MAKTSGRARMCPLQNSQPLQKKYPKKNPFLKLFPGFLPATPDMESRICPLCKTPGCIIFHKDTFRSYFICNTCGLVFVPRKEFLSAADEKSRYDLHRNAPEDQGYRKFLSRLFLPMQNLLAPGSSGLDFGCGPGPTLSVMFNEAGHYVSVYDQYYAQKLSLLKKQYDFITATEVLEHLRNPADELGRLWNCLKPGGWLGIMTKLVYNHETFVSWHYKNDPTHICFFARETFDWLSALWQAELTFIGKDVILFHKKPATE